jgi:hypothetical protein
MSETLPPGFVIDSPATDLPPGFVLDQAGATETTETTETPIGQAAQPAPAAEEQPGFGKRVLKEFGSRGTAVAVGGTAGAVAGTAAGPMGTIAGGALGAAAGSAVYDNVSNLVAALRDRPEEVVDAMGVTKNMLGEGAMDAAFSMGGALAQPIRFGRALLAKLSGVTSEASQSIQRTAERLGIGVGAVDVGGGLPKGYARSVGIFPFTGTPLRRGEKGKLQEASDAVNRTLDAFGPADTMNQIGVDMVAAARGAREEFKGTASQLYKTFEESVANASRQDIIPTQFVREDGSMGGIVIYALEAAAQAERGAVRLADGTIMPRAGTEGVTEFLEKLKDLPYLITPAQHRQLTQDLSDLIGKNLKDGADVKHLMEAKRSMEEGFANIRTDLLGEGEGEVVRRSLDAANGFYAKGIVQFQTRAAQSFERVDRLIFSSGAEKAGSLNADEVYKVAVNLRSPQQIQDLTKLVGQPNMKRAAARHFDDAVVASKSDIELMGDTFSVVDPAALERQLGLTGARRNQIEGLREFYKTAGVDLDQVTDLISVMKKIEGVGNASEFVRRRALLGGASAVTGALGGVGAGVVAGGVPGGAVTALGMTLLSRHMSKVFASPEKLKLMTSALDEAADATLRRAALGKLVNALVDEDEN